MKVCSAKLNFGKGALWGFVTIIWGHLMLPAEFF
jgi:hypothetical protein